MEPTSVGPSVTLGVVACTIAWIRLLPQAGGRIIRVANVICSVIAMSK